MRIVRGNDDNFEQSTNGVRPDDEQSTVIVTGLRHDAEWVFHGMFNIVVGDLVFARRLGDLHTPTLT